MKGADGLEKATISSSYYLLDALYRHGETEEFYKRLEFWRGAARDGLHRHARSARADAQRLASVGRASGLPHAGEHRGRASGRSRASRRSASRRCRARLSTSRRRWCIRRDSSRSPIVNRRRDFSVKLPEGITGELVFEGKSHALKPGKNEISL